MIIENFTWNFVNCPNVQLHSTSTELQIGNLKWHHTGISQLSHSCCYSSSSSSDISEESGIFWIPLLPFETRMRLNLRLPNQLSICVLLTRSPGKGPMRLQQPFGQKFSSKKNILLGMIYERDCIFQETDMEAKFCKEYQFLDWERSTFQTKFGIAKSLSIFQKLQRYVYCIC